MLIRYNEVTKSFNELSVLRGVNLEVYAGETITILGRSGSGKSVMVSMIVGLNTPDSGEIWVGEIKVSDFRSEHQWAAIRTKIGYLFQGSALFDSMNVFENVAFPLTGKEDLASEVVLKKVRDCLQKVALDESVLERYPDQLSGGMQKRVALARALVTQPQIIIYDEPTTGLDPMTARGIADLIRSLADELGTTSIVVTHDVGLARRVSDRLAVLFEGRIVEHGPYHQLMESSHPEVRSFLHEEIAQQGAL